MLVTRTKNIFSRLLNMRCHLMIFLKRTHNHASHHILQLPFQIEHGTEQNMVRCTYINNAELFKILHAYNQQTKENSNIVTVLGKKFVLFFSYIYNKTGWHYVFCFVHVLSLFYVYGCLIIWEFYKKMYVYTFWRIIKNTQKLMSFHSLNKN